MTSAGFEPVIPDIKHLQTFALKRAATGFCYPYLYCSVGMHFADESYQWTNLVTSVQYGFCVFVYNITVFSRESNVLRLDEKLVCSQSSVLLSLLACLKHS